VAYLLDTNVLVRLANVNDVAYLVAGRALAALHRRGEVVHITPQNLIEFRNVGPRPLALNGLGLTSLGVELKSIGFESSFPLLPDTPAIYPAWKTLVSAAKVIGKQVHDARLMAVCQVYGLTHLLTFNTADFVRFASIGAGCVIVHPATI